MTRDEKTRYLRVALALQKMGVTDEIADRIIETYEKVLELGGDFSVKDAVEIEIAMDRKYKELELTANKNETD